MESSTETGEFNFFLKNMYKKKGVAEKNLTYGAATVP